MGRPFSLSPRLKAVADLVPQGARLADVGTDHGRLPVWLIQHGKVPQAVASDLRAGPLSRGKALAERWGIGEKISFRLCDGLAEIRPGEAEVITITGMGGETIASILEAAPWAGEEGHLYILQAMSGQDGLRRYLSEHGFVILRELYVQEGDTLYVIHVARPGKAEPLTQGEIWVGRQARDWESPLRAVYLDQEWKKLCRAIEGLSKSQRPEDLEKRAYFQQVANEVAQIRKEWEQWQKS